MLYGLRRWFAAARLFSKVMPAHHLHRVIARNEVTKQSPQYVTFAEIAASRRVGTRDDGSEMPRAHNRSKRIRVFIFRISIVNERQKNDDSWSSFLTARK